MTCPSLGDIMSRVKRSSGKEYRRLSQAAESDDEVILYSLSPSSLPSVQPNTSTTEFGNGRYDQSLDLELPEIRRLPRKERRPAKRTRRPSRGLKAVYFSNEARACVVFLLLIAIVVGVVILVSNKLGVYWTPQISQQSSLVTAVPVATPTTQSPSNRPSGGPPSENPPEESTKEPTEETPKKENTTEPPEGGPTEPPKETPLATGGHTPTEPPKETPLATGGHTETPHLPPEEHTAIVAPTTGIETEDNEGSGSGEAAMETTSAAVSIITTKYLGKMWYSITETSEKVQLR